MLNRSALRRAIATVLLATLVVSALAPVAQAGSPVDDLKQIEYTYYFRGRYQQAIESLQTYLARVDLTAADRLRAREFLAASYVLGGAPAMGQQVFLQIMGEDPTYVGPDPGVFKLDVMNAYAEARTQAVARSLRDAPVTDTPTENDKEPASTVLTESAASKPIYKKWWLYAGAAAVAIAAGVLAGGGDDATDPSERGTVVVGVQVK